MHNWVDFFNVESMFFSALAQSQLARFIACLVSAVGILVVSITVPGFHNVMALLGAFFSIVVSIIFPEACYLVLFGQELSLLEKIGEVSVIILASLLALFGTIWAFLPTADLL